ncbi:MAG: lipopolysaccharide heptosyltransferase family protein [Bacteroidota bacterium]|nr:lipopolysaccharide heptosyltransferase family protein [Bacteroidota bacterium]
MDFKNLNLPKCKKFSGYKPCISYKNCLEHGCQLENSQTRTGKKILIISLDALGNVLLNTSILRSLKNKYPVSTVCWITMKSATAILANNQYIDRLYSWNDDDRMILRNIEFDVMLNSDKSAYACAFANEIKSKEKFGFLLNSDGKIIPANDEAMYNYMMGIDDELKFRKNIKSGSEIIHKTFALRYNRDEYVFNFTESELEFIDNYKEQIKYDRNKVYVGFNTGCSNLFPNKKMTIEQHIELINDITKYDNFKILLLGGNEDTERNLKIYESLSKEVQKQIIYTPTNLGIRNGACFMSIPDIVITGDSFGMHLAIALKKYVIAWFGLSCWNEIDLFDRGEKLIPEGLECAPCWNKVCPYNLECIQMIDLKKISELLKKYALVKPIVNFKN